jgi:hypothetical protein
MTYIFLTFNLMVLSYLSFRAGEDVANRSDKKRDSIKSVILLAAINVAVIYLITDGHTLYEVFHDLLKHVSTMFAIGAVYTTFSNSRKMEVA